MKNEDVTKQVLQKRVIKRTDFEDKYGIGPLTTEEIDLILKHQNNGNDRLDSNILASKSKNCKRSIPAREILGRSLATDLALSISKMLAKYSLYTLSHITLVILFVQQCYTPPILRLKTHSYLEVFARQKLTYELSLKF